MSYAAYIGRVGVLAVALGVGAAVATHPGIVFADPTDAGSSNTGSPSADSGAPGVTESSTGAVSIPSGSSATSGTSSTSVSSPDESPATAAPSNGSTPTVDPGIGTPQDSGGTDIESSTPTEAETQPAVPTDSAQPAAQPPSAGMDSALGSTPQPSSDDGSGVPSTDNSIEILGDEEPSASPLVEPSLLDTAVTAIADSTLATISAFSPGQRSLTSAAEGEVSPNQPQEVPTFFHGVLAPLNLLVTAAAHVLAWVGAFAGATPGGSVESPLLLLLMGWMRRRSEQSLVPETPVIDQSAFTTSQTFDLVTAVDETQQLSVHDGIGVPDPVAGAVSGSLNTSGLSMTYTLTQGSSMGGSVTVNTDGTFHYTPGTSARLAAAQTMGVDLDSFTVAASDGQTTTTTTVRVPVSPANLAVASESGQTAYNPGGVAIVGDRAYVANRSSNSVSVLDISTLTPTLLTTIPVGSRPTGMAVGSSDGTKLYVTNTGSNSVSIIDTTAPTPTVIATIPVGLGPSSIAVSPYGSRVYVVNTSGGTVSVIDTALRQVIGTLGVGYMPGAVAINPDGTRLYVTRKWGNSVLVIDTTMPTPKILSEVTVGAAPSSVAVSGTRAFVANQNSNTVSVIDTTAPSPKVIATIAVGRAPTSIVLSADETAAFVAGSFDTVAVIDVGSNAIIRTVSLDARPEWGAQTLALNADGTRLYVSDQYDRALRSMSLVTGTSMTTGQSSLAIPGAGGRTLSATWYFPNKDERPAGLIYLQHGFFRSSANVSALARQLADSTNSIVVTPTISSDYFDPYNIWGSPIQRAVALMFSGDRSALTASASAAAGRPVSLPDAYVLAGHSAGGSIVSAAAGHLADSGAIGGLKAVILFDTVDTGEGKVGLGKLRGANARPVYLIAAQPCSCNYGGGHANSIINSPPDEFVAIMLDGGGHVDVEGVTTDWYASLFCGGSRPQNVTALQGITASWVNHVFTGSPTGITGPKGTVIPLGNATARVIGFSSAPVV
jgi:YVTN family beta-propeller protein/VCBS repeat-containing protein